MSAKKRMPLQFDDSAKQHDGLCAQSRLLQDLIHAYFEAQVLDSKEVTHAFVQTRMDKYKMDPDEALPVLCAQLAKLIKKTSRLDLVESTAVLERGGGKGHVVQSAHCPHLRRLQNFLTT